MKKYRCFFLGGMDVLVIFVIHFAITNTFFLVMTDMSIFHGFPCFYGHQVKIFD